MLKYSEAFHKTFLLIVKYKNNPILISFYMRKKWYEKSNGIQFLCLARKLKIPVFCNKKHKTTFLYLNSDRFFFFAFSLLDYQSSKYLYFGILSFILRSNRFALVISLQVPICVGTMERSEPSQYKGILEHHIGKYGADFSTLYMRMVTK